MVDVVLTGSKKLAKLKATLTLEGTMAHINFDVGDTEMKDETMLLKRLREYGILNEPKPEPVTTPTSIRTTPVIMDSNEAVTAPTTVNAIDAAVVTPPP